MKHILGFIKKERFFTRLFFYFLEYWYLLFLIKEICAAFLVFFQIQMTGRQLRTHSMPLRFCNIEVKTLRGLLHVKTMVGFT
jgi:hypothetical protein